MRTRISTILVFVGTLTVVASLLLHADEQPAIAITDLTPLHVEVQSVAGGNFSSYSVPVAGSTIDLDLTKLLTNPDDRVIHVKAGGDDTDWYIPLPTPPHVEFYAERDDIESIRLVSEAQHDGSRLRIEMQRFAEADNAVRVWFISEFNHITDSVAFGTAKLEPGQTLLRRNHKD